MGRSVDMGFEQGGFRDIATVMVIRIKNRITVFQQLCKRFPVAIKRDIEHGDAAGGSLCEPSKKRYVPFDTGDESRPRLRLMQA